jgi:hypothetical protein
MIKKRHLQFWKEGTYELSFQDVSRILYFSLSFIADSLPLALDGLRTASPEDQEKFWRAFICLDGETEFATKRLPQNNPKVWIEMLNDLTDTAAELYHRDTTPTSGKESL